MQQILQLLKTKSVDLAEFFPGSKLKSRVAYFLQVI